MNQLKLQVVLEALDKATAPLKSINRQVSKSSKLLKNTKAQLDKLNQAQKNIAQFKSYQDSADKAFKAVSKLTDEQYRLQRAVSSTNDAEKTLKASRKNYSKLIKSESSHLKKYTAALDDLEQQLDNTKKPTIELIKATKKARTAVMASESILAEYRQKHLETSAAISKNSAQAKKYKTRIESLNGRIEKGNQKFLKYKHQAAALGDKLRDAGIDTNYLATENAKLTSKIEAQTRAVEKHKRAMDKLNRRNRRLQEWRSVGDKTASAGRYLTPRLSAPIGAGVGLAAREAIAVEKAMASVGKFAPDFDGNSKKQVEFLAEIKAQTAQLSMQTGKTQVDIAAMFEEMGAAGIAADKWATYADTFIKGAVALDMEVGELSQGALGIMAATGHKGDDKWLQQLLEQSNLASDMGKMRAADVLNVANRSMGLAKNAGISEEAFISLTGAALDAGGAVDVTGRAWKTIIARLTSTAKLTKTQAAAWDALKIDPDTFTKAFKDDPVAQLQALSKAAEKNQDAMGQLGVIVGTEFVDTVVKMGGNIETAKKIQVALTDEQKRAKKYQAEYDRMLATTDTQLGRLTATTRVLGVTIGDQLLPQINKLLQKLQPLIKNVAEWIKANPELTQKLLLLAGAAAVLGPALLVVGSAITTITTLLSLSPLGALILLVAALVVGAYYLSKNWEKVVKWFKEDPFGQTVAGFAPVVFLVDVIRNGVQLFCALLDGDWSLAWESAGNIAEAALDMIKAPLKMLWEWAKKLAGYVGIDLGAAFETMKDIAVAVLDFVLHPFDSLMNAGKTLAGYVGIDLGAAFERLDAIVSPILNTLSDALSGVAEIIRKVVDGFNSVIGIDKNQIVGLFSGNPDTNSLLGLTAKNIQGGIDVITGKSPLVKEVAPVSVSNDNKKTLNQTNNNTFNVTVNEATASGSVAGMIAKAAATGYQRANAATIGDTN